MEKSLNIRKISKIVSYTITKLKIHKNEFSWVVIGQIVSLLGAIGGLKVLTNTLGPEGYGQLALGMTIAVILQQIFYGPLSQAAYRYYSIYRDTNKLDIFWDALVKASIYSIVIILFLCIFAGIVVKIYFGNMWFYLIVFAVIFGILDGINCTLVALQNAERQRKVVALLQGLIQVLRPLAGAAAAMIFARKGYIVLAGFSVAMILITLYQGRFLGNLKFNFKENNIENNEVYKNLFAYSYPFLIWGIFGAIQFSADRWILKYFYSEREVGIYAAMYQIANAPIIIIIGIISQFMMPILFEKSNKNDVGIIHKSVNKIVILFLSLSIFLVFLYYLFSGYLINILSKKDFLEYKNLLPLILLGLVFFQAGQLLYLFPQSTLKTNKYIFPKFLSMLILVTSGILLVKYLGFKGIIYANLMTGFVYLMNILFLNRKHSAI